MNKPESYTEADWKMVLGYLDGSKGMRAKNKSPAYMHGYRNGLADYSGTSFERADVLRRRASMIPGITVEKGDLK